MNEGNQVPGESLALAAYLRRALVDWFELANLEVQGQIAEEDPKTLVFRAANRAVTSGPPLDVTLRRTLNLYVPSPVYLKYPSKPFPHDGTRPASPGTWSELADRVASEGALIMCIEAIPRETWESYVRPRLSLWTASAGFTLHHEVWNMPEHAEIWLAPTRRAAWLPSPEDLERLLRDLILRHGGPKTTARVKAERRRPPTAFEAPVEHTALVDWRRWEMVGVEIWLDDGPTPVDDLRLSELVGCLLEAGKSAARGYVGLKHFREHLMPAKWTIQERRALIEAAVGRDIVHAAEVEDRATGKMVRSLQPNDHHELVRAVKAARAK